KEEGREVRIGSVLPSQSTEMGRKPCCSREDLNRGAWSPEEDSILKAYVQTHGEGRWSILPKKAGLKRCGKSCRLRWLNYLRPNIKRGNISEQEEDLIIRLHRLLGNKWSLIAGRLPGRTDNEIKNYWNTNLKKRMQSRSSSAQELKCNENEERPREGAAPAAEAASPTHAEEHPVVPDRVIRSPALLKKPNATSAMEKQEATVHARCSTMDPQMEGIWDFLLNGDGGRHESKSAIDLDENPLMRADGELQMWSDMARALEREGRMMMPSPVEYSSCGENLGDWSMLFGPVQDDGNILDVELFSSSLLS
ncbi:hypothetical protein Taro_051780, partial [Colocasia esculenta]|nr:hypothetical protein [Colocasia esculenta]